MNKLFESDYVVRISSSVINIKIIKLCALEYTIGHVSICFLEYGNAYIARSIICRVAAVIYIPTLFIVDI